MKHATIVPLIGGETLGQELAFGTRPEYLVSYTAFKANDSHIVNHYDNEVPYYLLDNNEKPDIKVDVMGTVCPCAGLSQLSHGFGDHNENNKWMIETANYVLGELRPRVFWGENAPGFAGKIGDTVRNQLRKIAKDNGYVMSVYRTRTLLHGGPQVRDRSFYFFWQGSRVPIFNYFRRPYEKIENVILNAKGNSQREVINPKKPSEDPYYRFILEHIHGGISHREYVEQAGAAKVRENDTQSYIEKMGYNYIQVAEWMKSNGFDREVAKCEYRHAKLTDGKNIMRRMTIIPKDHIGAFVGHYPHMLTHPVEDRYINYREAMTIMGLPDNFELLDAKKSTNHICQNVPVMTAKDMAGEIKKWLEGELDEVESDYVLQSNISQNFKAETRGGGDISAWL